MPTDEQVIIQHIEIGDICAKEHIFTVDVVVTYNTGATLFTVNGTLKVRDLDQLYAGIGKELKALYHTARALQKELGERNIERVLKYYIGEELREI